MTNVKKAHPMTVHSHLPGLLRCVLGAFLVLASASAAAAQAEFHYQYGKLTNPFSGAREYTSILTVQQCDELAVGGQLLFCRHPRRWRS